MQAATAVLVASGCAASPSNAPAVAVERVELGPPAPAPPSLTPAPKPWVAGPPSTSSQRLAAEQIADVLARAAAHYAPPFECDFESTLSSDDRAPRRSHLRMTFERPGRFLVASSDGTAVVAAGGVLSVADMGRQDVVRSSVGDELIPAAFSFVDPGFASRGEFFAYPQGGGDVFVFQRAGDGLPKLGLLVASSGEVRRVHVATKGGRQLLDDFTCTMHTSVPGPTAFTVWGMTSNRPIASPLIGLP